MDYVNAKTAEAVDDILKKANPAFPVSIPTRTGVMTAAGLSKRELFAAMAMQAMIPSEPEGVNVSDLTALYAVRHADALIAELVKGAGE